MHLGDEFNTKTRVASLAAVVSAAKSQAVDLLIIAGDLFDSSRVKDDVVRAAMDEMARLTVPIIVIPGNHDCVDQHSIYKRVNLSDAGSHVRFIGDPAGGGLLFEELRLSLWGRGIEDHHPGHRPLQGYAPHPDDAYWRLVVTHGHYVEDGEDSYRSSKIHAKEIAELKADYLALGHWHRFLDVSANGVKAFYCGSPGEPGDSYASANLVLLDPKEGVKVHRVPITGV